VRSDSGHPQGDDYLLKVDNPLVLPVNKKVRVITTANDVIHAWMVPAFGVKQDAIPGFVRDIWLRADKTGDFYGQCAELCGKEHAYMPIHVKILSDADYSKWVEGKLKEIAAKADDPQGVVLAICWRAAKVYAANCAVRHKLTAPVRPDRARRLAGGDRRRQGQATAGGAQRHGQGHAAVETTVGHRPRGGAHVHEEPLEQQDRAAGAAVRSGCGAQVTPTSLKAPKEIS
jgi:cytochrome c oxidase subunit 2